MTSRERLIKKTRDNFRAAVALYGMEVMKPIVLTIGGVSKLSDAPDWKLRELSKIAIAARRCYAEKHPIRKITPTSPVQSKLSGPAR